jgi:hypothetical protein
LRKKNVYTKEIAPAGGKVFYRPLELLYRPLQLLQGALKFFTARWSLERVVKCNFTARQSRKNRHVKKKQGRQYMFRPNYPSLINHEINSTYIKDVKMGKVP